MYTRREFGTLTLGAIAAAGLKRVALDAWAAIDPVVNGVRLGAQTYSFRDLPRTPAGDAIEPDGLQRCRSAHCWQDGGKAMGQHRLARPWGPGEREV